MLILVLNCGSSSLKCQIFEATKELQFKKVFAADAECLNAPASILTLKYPQKQVVFEQQPLSHKLCLNWILSYLKHKEFHIDVISHRVVHGGRFFYKATFVNDDVLKHLEQLSELAPLHNPISLQGIRIISELLPNVPQAIVCDTAFFKDIPEEQHRYAVSEELYDMGVQKYGAHGTNYSYLVRYMQNFLDGTQSLTGILAHLGQGASITAIKNGKAKYTSMGFSPLTGCQMGSRCGNIDPMVVPYIMKKKNCPVEQIMKIFNKESGLIALTGTNDIREVLTAASRDSMQAKLALDMFVDSVAKEIANGIIAMQEMPKQIVFSAGIGQNSPKIREKVCSLLQKTILPTLRLDMKANKQSEFKISTPTSGIDLYVIPANEELEIAMQSYELISNN